MAKFRKLITETSKFIWNWRGFNNLGNAPLTLQGKRCIYSEIVIFHSSLAFIRYRQLGYQRGLVKTLIAFRV